MPKSNTFVVVNPEGQYLIGYNQGTPPDSLFGNLGDALDYETLEIANEVAGRIGGGTVGVPRPK